MNHYLLWTGITHWGLGILLERESGRMICHLYLEYNARYG